VAILAAGNALIAVFSASSLLGGGLLWGGLMLGPLVGWIEAIVRGRLSGALGLLLSALLCVLVPALVYAVNRSTAALGLAALCWFASGWLFVIGIWV